MKKRFTPSGARGYTLLELLVAAGLIGLIATIMFASFSKSQAKSRDTRRHADLAIIKVALESYFSDHNQYPETLNFGQVFQDDENQVFLKITPQDPQYPQKEYCYAPTVDSFNYTLGADFENEAKQCN